jgi:protein ImuB
VGFALRAALGGLPIEALRIDAEACEALREVGIERIDELARVARSMLPARFGAQVVLRLDQAWGAAIETFAPVRARGAIRVRREFEGPTTHGDALGACSRELVHELCAELLRRERGVTLLELRLTRADLCDCVASVSCSVATREPRHLWTLVRPTLERMHLGFGVEAIAMTALRTRAIAHEQASRWVDEGQSRDRARCLGELVDTLVGRLGRDGVRVATLAGSHVPERAAVLKSVCESREGFERLARRDGGDGGSADVVGPTVGAGVGSGVGPGVVLPRDRPSVLFPSVFPARVVALTPDGPVHALAWAGGEGEVVACVGPERIAGEWWRGDAWTREYFKVQDAEGRWLWLYREEGGGWFVQGEW